MVKRWWLRDAKRYQKLDIYSGGGGGGSELVDGQRCAILALELVPKNLIFA